MTGTRTVEALALRPRDVIVETTERGSRRTATIKSLEMIGLGVGKIHVSLTSKSTYVYDAHAHVEIAA